VLNSLQEDQDNNILLPAENELYPDHSFHLGEDLNTLKYLFTTCFPSPRLWYQTQNYFFDDPTHFCDYILNLPQSKEILSKFMQGTKDGDRIIEKVRERCKIEYEKMVDDGVNFEVLIIIA
jgi:hypothetical protein